MGEDKVPRHLRPAHSSLTALPLQSTSRVPHAHSLRVFLSKLPFDLVFLCMYILFPDKPRKELPFIADFSFSRCLFLFSYEPNRRFLRERREKKRKSALRDLDKQTNLCLSKLTTCILIITKVKKKRAQSNYTNAVVDRLLRFLLSICLVSSKILEFRSSFKEL